MPDTKFLEEYGLYRKYPFPAAGSCTLGDIPSPSLQRYCPCCKDERTWVEQRGTRHRVGTQPDGNREDPFWADQPVRRCCVCFTYVCSGCQQCKVKYIVLFGADRVQLPKQADKLDEFFLAEKAAGHVLKIGQYPPWSIDPPKELKVALGKYEELYKRGTICESQGYGIGAFAYYRRIIENTVDQMLDDIGELLEPDEQKKYRAALGQVASSKVAQEKIEVVKDMLPNVLRPGGLNPLQMLHDSLSVGIHQLSEDDCLAFAEEIRQSLTMLSKHIALAKQDKEEYAAKLTSVKDRLDKIRRKQKGTD